MYKCFHYLKPACINGLIQMANNERYLLRSKFYRCIDHIKNKTENCLRQPLDIWAHTSGMDYLYISEIAFMYAFLKLHCTVIC